MRKKNPIWFALDAILALLYVGFIHVNILIWSNGGSVVITNPTPLEHTSFASFFVLVVLSLLLGLKVKHGIWSDDPASKKLGWLYMTPFVSVAVAYWRLRNGRGIAIKPAPKLLPWQQASKMQNKPHMATPRKHLD